MKKSKKLMLLAVFPKGIVKADFTWTETAGILPAVFFISSKINT
jgi:hypothetical protein